MLRKPLLPPWACGRTQWHTRGISRVDIQCNDCVIRTDLALGAGVKWFISFHVLLCVDVYGAGIASHNKCRVRCCIGRQSSSANVGDDKHSQERQVQACQRYADMALFTIKAVLQDPAVSGTDPLINRPGFSKMIKYCQGPRTAQGVCVCL